MKKLSIEEKAKRYDEAIKRAEKWRNAPNVGKIPTFANRVIEEIFPELKESEDERIRKMLIEQMERWHECALENNVVQDIKDSADAITWLEKLGEKTKPIEGFNTEFEKQVSCLIASAMNRDYEYTKAFVKWASEGLLNYAKREIEKNNMGISEATKKKLEDNLNKALEKETPESWNEFLDEQGEQKTTNTIEPKFHEGDWIINNEHYNVAKVLEINNEQHRLDYGDTVGTVIISLIDNDYHLWTIEDAKDGDVLADDASVILFRKIGNKRYEDVVDYHCVVESGKFEIQEKDYYWGKTNDVPQLHPATKEQRDILMKAMADAGYTVDFEKKELKKIEHKLAENEELTEFDKAVGVSIGTWNPKTPEQIQSVKAVSKKLLKLAKKQINDEQKLAWSEEDIETISRVISIVKWAAYSDHSHPILNDEGATELVKRLKSLKDRVQPQPKQEWSEEDEKMIRVLISMCDVWATSNQFYPKENKEMEAVKTWLNRLKERYTWKPSERQIQTLEFIVEYHAFANQDRRKDVVALLSDLKNLKG